MSTLAIVNLHPDTIVCLAEAVTRADAEGKRMRILTGQDLNGDTWVKWDNGGGWTAACYEADADKPHIP